MTLGLRHNAVLFTTGFLVLLALGLFAINPGWAGYDQDTYHLPLANQFLEEGFRLDYPSTSATTPATHLLAAWLAGLFGIERLATDSPFIKTLFSLIGALNITIFVNFCYALCRHLPASLAIGFAVFSSNWFLRPSNFLITEALTYLGYLGVMGVMLFGRHSWRWGALFAAAGSIMVLSRQLFLPVALVYGLFALPLRRDRLLTDCPGIVLVTAIPALAFLPLVLAWGGLTPPEFQVRHETASFNWSVITHNLALTGIFAVPFFLVSPPPRAAMRKILPLVVIAALCTAVFLVSETDLNRAEGRNFSVIWVISNRFPTLWGEPVVLLGLMLTGGFSIYCHLVNAWKSRRYPVEWLLFGLYNIALGAQLYSWQRYGEVFILISLGISSASALAPRRWTLALFVAGFAVYFALSLVTMFGGLYVRLDRAA